jgi:tRNA nucleotidyltransferase (CCA-adding enzyme)
MADFVYLLQTRLTSTQQHALSLVRDVARTKGVTVFLVGGAVRDLISGSPVRDLDIVIQGNAIKLKKELQQAKLTLVGESAERQSLYFTMPGGVRLEVGSTLTVTYPKPGKPVAKPANILDDLRSRDFTANAMAISLNDGSYGLLMDPLNGVADIENRELRLVSPYGFIEDPARMIRAARLGARLGWHMEEKTQQRYETGKTEDYIKVMSDASRGYELEEVFHEEDPLRVMRRLESEGWMKSLSPVWSASKTNENELNKLRDVSGQLETMNIHADPSTAYFPLLTAKLTPKDISGIKSLFPRQGFVEQIAKLEAETKDFTTKFTNKAVSSPSETWKLLMSSVPEQILSLAYSSKSAPVQARFNTFFNESPQARQRIPYQTMQEMRITPDLPIYNQLVEELFFAIMDKKLETIEAVKAFLEPHSPPAPPPPISLRRRAVKKAEKPAKRAKKAAAVVVPTEAVAAEAPAPEAAPAKPVKAAKEAPPAKVAPAKAVPVKKAEKPAPAKKAPVKAAHPAKKAAAKPAPKKIVAKAKPAPAKKVVAKKPVAKKAAAKPAPKKPVAKKAPAKPVKKPAPKKPVPKAKPKKR